MLDISWIFTAASLTGAIFNARGKILGFYIWIPANIAWAIYDWYIGELAQSFLFIIYTVITCFGVYQWRKKKIGKS